VTTTSALSLCVACTDERLCDMDASQARCRAGSDAPSTSRCSTGCVVGLVVGLVTVSAAVVYALSQSTAKKAVAPSGDDSPAV
jgi:hypothetical protein